MQRSKLGKFIDNTVIMLIITLLSFTLFKSIIINNLLCLALSLIVGFVAIKIIINIQNRHYHKLSIKNDEIENIDKYNFELRKMSKENQLDFFNNMFKPYNPKLCEDGLILENNIYLKLFLHKDTLCPEDIFYCYSLISKTEKDIKELVIVCNNINNDLFPLLDKFTDIKFTLFSKAETYSLMKKANNLPSLPEEKTQKLNKFTKFRGAFAKKQSKLFIRCGLLLYLSSLFIPFTNYYIIVASILLIVGVVIYCFGKDEEKILPISSSFFQDNSFKINKNKKS